MAESSTITTLRTKRDQIEGLIAHLEDRIKEARTDLAHVNTTLRLFEMDGGARVRRDWRGRGRTARRRVAQELVRAIESAIRLLDGGLNTFDLLIRLFTQPLGLFNKLPPPRDGLRRFTQIGSLW